MGNESGIDIRDSSAEESVQQIPVEVSSDEWKSRYESISKELEETKKLLQQVEKEKKGNERSVSRIQQEKKALQNAIETLGSRLAAIESMIELQTRREAGEIDDSLFQEERKKIMQQKQTATVAQSVRKVLDDIRETLLDVGLDPEGNDPDVVAIRADFAKAVAGDGDVMSVLRDAEKLARAKLKAQKVPEKAKEIASEEKQEPIKETAKNLSTATPNVANLSAREILARYASGDKSVEHLYKKLFVK